MRTIALICLLAPLYCFSQSPTDDWVKIEWEDSKLTFAEEVTWEIFDAWGNFMSTDTGQIIRGDDFDDGRYWIKIKDTEQIWGFSVKSGIMGGIESE